MVENKYREYLLNSFKIISVIIYGIFYVLLNNYSFPFLLLFSFLFCDALAMYLSTNNKKYILHLGIYIIFTVLSLISSVMAL